MYITIDLNEADDMPDGLLWYQAIELSKQHNDDILKIDTYDGFTIGDKIQIHNDLGVTRTVAYFYKSKYSDDIFIRTQESTYCSVSWYKENSIKYTPK